MSQPNQKVRNRLIYEDWLNGKTTKWLAKTHKLSTTRILHIVNNIKMMERYRNGKTKTTAQTKTEQAV